MTRVESDLFIVADQSNEVSNHDKNFVPCPMSSAVLFRMIQRGINLLEKIGE